MPSDAAVPASPRVPFLRSQELGLICGQATVLLLGIGSVIIVSTRDGASADVQLDDVTTFFRAPSWVHWWFYALLGVLSVYVVNTALATWDSVSLRWRQGVRGVQAWGASVIHVSFLVGLLAHLVGGLRNTELPQVTLGPGWSKLGSHQARLLHLEVVPLPNGSIKSVDALIDVREPSGETHQQVVAYNEPLSSGAGSELWLIAEPNPSTGAIVLTANQATCTIIERSGCSLGALRVIAGTVQQSPHGIVAMMEVTHAKGVENVVLRQGEQKQLSSGEVLRFAAITGVPTVTLRGRSTPGHPWALASATLLAVGLLMMGRRWLLV